MKEKPTWLAYVAMSLMVCLLIGSFFHNVNMQNEYFQNYFFAILVVFAYESGMLFVSWQKGANRMKLKYSWAMGVFTVVVWFNILMANLTDAFLKKFGMELTLYNLTSGLDPFQLFNWLITSLATPCGVAALSYIVADNMSATVERIYKEHQEKQKQPGNEESTFDLENGTVDKLREQLQDHFDQHGINIKVTDDVLARHLGKTKRTIVRKRKEDREREEASQNITRVRVGTNGHYGVG